MSIPQVMTMTPAEYDGWGRHFKRYPPAEYILAALWLAVSPLCGLKPDPGAMGWWLETPAQRRAREAERERRGAEALASLAMRPTANNNEDNPMANDVRIGGLYADFRTRNAQFLAGMRRNGEALRRNQRLVRGLRRTVRNYTRDARAMVRQVISVRTAVVTLAGTGGLGLLINRHVTLADEIIKSARATGLSTKAFQELRFAADLSGVSAEQFTSAMIAFSKRVGEARYETGQLTTFLKRLDPALYAQVQGAKTTEEAFELIIRKALSLDNELERTALLAAAFGRTVGPKLANFLLQGEAGIDAVRRRAQELGVVISKDLLVQSEAVKDRMSELGHVLRTRVSTAVLHNADQIEALVRVLIEKLPPAIDGSIDLLQKLADNLALVGAVLAGIAGANIGRFFGPVGAAVGGLVTGITAYSYLTGLASQQSESFADSLGMLDGKIEETRQHLANLNDDWGDDLDDAPGAVADSYRRVTEELDRLIKAREQIITAGKSPRRVLTQPSLVPKGNDTLNTLTTETPALPENTILARTRDFLRELAKEAERRNQAIEARGRLRGLEGEALAREQGRLEAIGRLTERRVEAERTLAEAKRNFVQAHIAENEQAKRAAAAQVREALRATRLLDAQNPQLAEQIDLYGELFAKAERQRYIGQLFERTRTPLERYRAEIARLNTLVDEGADGWELYGRALALAQEEFDEATQRSDENYQRLRRTTEDVADAFTRFADRAISGFDNIGDAARELGRAIVDALTQALILDPLRQGLSKEGGILERIIGAVLGGLSTGATPPFVPLGQGVPVGQAILGARQHGGPVQAGHAYLVGERGMEAFIPNVSGQVLPNQALRGLGGGDVVNNVTFVIESDNEAAVERAIGRALPVLEEYLESKQITDFDRHSALRSAVRG